MEPIVLRPFQETGVKFLTERRGALLTDEQGLGKTVQAVWAAKEVATGPILVISRPLNKRFWRQTIKTIDPAAPVITTYEGGHFNEETVKAWFKYPRTRGYLIIHHESLRLQVNLLKSFGIWDIVIADEAHRFKNRKSQMTQCLKSVPSFVRWGLTGTPMEKSPGDYWSLLNWFDPKMFSAYWRFYDNFVNAVYIQGFGGTRVELGLKNVEGLAQTLAPYVLGRKKEEVAPELPELLIKDVPLEMSQAHAALYKDIARKYFVDLQAYGPGSEDATDAELFIKSALHRLSLLQKAAIDPSLVGSPAEGNKTEWILDWLQDYETEQLVVFTHFKDYANGLGVRLPGSAVITGDVPIRRRDEIVGAFQNGSLRVLIGTIDTMSESINLQNARYAVFTDLHSSSILMNQAYGRVHRIGSRSDVVIARLLTEKTVDYLAKARLEKKFTDIQTVQNLLKHMRAL